jgi:Zn finger protein HypA/HybF involved in hydrogenase expression
MDSIKFRFSNIKWKALRTTNPVFAGAAFGTELLSAVVKCKKCEHEWLSGRTTPVGAFLSLPNDYRFACPKCGSTEDVQSGQLFSP